MKNTAITLFITVLLVASAFGVGAATQAGALIPAAIPFALALIFVIRLLGPKPELIAWAVFTTGLLAGTYLSTGGTLEYVIFVVYAVLSILGVFKSPYFLALAWLFHPIWDFVPRTLPTAMHDLPMACAFFDTPIGLYLLWGAWKKRWTVFGNESVWGSNTGKTMLIALAMAIVTLGVIFSAASHVLLIATVPLAVAIILVFRAMGAKAEFIAWAFFTGWAGMTYAHTGGMLEALVFLAYVVLSALAVFVSPYFLLAAWLVFIPWSLMPHELSNRFPEFAPAGVLFALIVSLYFVWQLRAGRWSSANKTSTQAETTDTLKLN